MNTLSTTPKEAATVILLRKSYQNEDIEVLMVKRHPKSVFVPNCYVFPGGCVEDEDLESEMESLCRNLNRDLAYNLLKNAKTKEIALASWIAGIRETFEETGILLAYDKEGNFLADGHYCSNVLKHVREKHNSFRDLLMSNSFLLATDRLVYFAHWITPEGLPHRYDVRFFLVEVSPLLEAEIDGKELTEHTWISPRDALKRYEEGNFSLVLPTIMTLKEISAFRNIEELMRHAQRKIIPTILTRISHVNGRLVEIMPDGKIFSPLR
ncbi:MAG: hypothetical protein N2317_04175 [Syntrophales bacterium]|nr:hypothetical protein [Syntrophales bacterium]